MSESSASVLSSLGARDSAAGRYRCDAARRPKCTTGPDAIERPAPQCLTDRLFTDPVDYFTFNAACAASGFRNGTTPGISHLSHCSSTFVWK